METHTLHCQKNCFSRNGILSKLIAGFSIPLLILVLNRLRFENNKQSVKYNFIKNLNIILYIRNS